ncbi:MAG: aldo/keto reductase [Simkaniaceae bacterium]|nr:aldo/keto reductase [Candidatus Sacchlamyda saccharinae]
MKIPLIGLGTYKLLGDDCIRAVKMALDIGYRHFDTAFAYENHKAIAEAISGFDRSSLFLTTKLAIGLGQIDDSNIETSLEIAVDTALKELRTDYIDLLLIHWPDKTRPIDRILLAMHKLVEKGKIQSPGVSNYTIRHLQDAYDAGLSIPYNQVEFHPYLYQKELLDFARAHGTELIAYRSFGGGKLIDQEPLFTSIGEKYGKTPSQVILRWTIQKNIPVIPKASSKKHLEENFALQDFALNSSEEAALDRLNKNFRYCISEWNEFDY